MPQLVPIQAKCPTCQSRDVFYTCHVTCCFNHVCNDCKTTFELATHAIRNDSHRINSVAEMADRDTTLPTAPCASCEKTDVLQIEGTNDLYCISCCSILALEYEKIVANRQI